MGELRVYKDRILETAIDRTIEAMPDDFVIKPFLEAHKAEVKGMLLTEYNEARTMELFKEEGHEEGRQEGQREGRQEERAEGFELLSFLIGRLMELGRVEDVARVTRDPAYRDRLLNEFKLNVNH